MGNVTPSFHDPSGHSGAMGGATGHTAGVPRGSADGTPVLPVTSVVDGSRTHVETQTGVHEKMSDMLSQVNLSQLVSKSFRVLQGILPLPLTKTTVNVTTADGRCRCLCIRRIPNTWRGWKGISQVWDFSGCSVHRMLGHNRLSRSPVLLLCGIVNGCRKSNRLKRDFVQRHVGPLGKVVDQVQAALILGHGGLVPATSTPEASQTVLDTQQSSLGNA